VRSRSLGHGGEPPARGVGSTGLRLRIWWETLEWPVVGALAVLTVVLGYLGFHSLYRQMGQPQDLTNLLYLTAQLFVLQSGFVGRSVPLALDIARFLAPALAVYTALNALAVIFRAQLQLVRLRLSRGHIVVCGLGRKGVLLTESLRARGDKVVAVERQEGCEGVGRARECGATVVVGDATMETVLRRARVTTATHIVCVCDDDGVNATIAVAARRLAAQRRKGTLTCHVHLTDFEVWRLMRERELAAGRTLTPSFRLEFFNVYESGAAILLSPDGRFAPASAPSDGRRPHVVIVGLGGLGRSVAVHAAQAWHLSGAPPSRRPRITAVDIAAESKVAALLERYPGLAGCCEPVACQIDVRSREFEAARFIAPADDRDEAPTVYVCFDDDQRSLLAALTLHQRTHERHVPVVARMIDTRGLTTLLEDDPGGVIAFPLLELTCTPERVFEGTHERLARAIHEEYLRGRRAAGDTRESNSSLREWAELDESLRESSRRQADHVGVKLESVGCGISPLGDWSADPVVFSSEEIEHMARMEHERWCAEKEGEGYKTGPGPKEAKKTHPCLVPWEDLSEDVREIDGATVRALPLLLARAGFSVYRADLDAEHARGGSES
jgi:voltage-gated potassium channel Kch